MRQPTHDPYLNTVHRALKEKAYRTRQLQLKAQSQEKQTQNHSFLHQRLELNELIHLPEGIGNFIFFVAFILIPYIVGVLFIFVTIAGIDLQIFKGINIQEYTIYWAIGYEVIAFFLLMLIFKSAIEFKRNRKGHP